MSPERDLRVRAGSTAAWTRQEGEALRLLDDAPWTDPRDREQTAPLAEVPTLLPGDIISTGTPSGVGPIQPGDVAEVEVEGVGTLANPVTEG